MITSLFSSSKTARHTLAAWAFAIGLIAFVAVGCGPTQSTILIGESEVAFEKAMLVDAAAKAPYEYWSAKEYLHKAKEEWGYSNFEKSAEYATLAQQFSEEALRKAKGVATPMQPEAKESPEKSREPSKGKRGTFQTNDSEADALENIE